jgi:hypothetical protein
VVLTLDKKRNKTMVNTALRSLNKAQCIWASKYLKRTGSNAYSTKECDVTATISSRLPRGAPERLAFVTKVTR